MQSLGLLVYEILRVEEYSYLQVLETEALE